MSDLKGKFAGYETDGVIVAASSPATESAEKVLECQKNGAAAVMLKTASKTRMPSTETTPRRCHVRNGFFWAKSSFNREILTLEQGEALIRNCKTSGVTIPIAASVTELTLETADWLESCKRMEAAGADALQIDLFYIENMLCEPDFEKKFVKLLCDITGSINIPIMPKLNISLPAGYAAYLLKQGGIKYVSLLDSIKTPPPLFVEWKYHGRIGEPKISLADGLSSGGLSVFGSFMLPVTAQYTDTLAQTGFEVCAGGGVTDGAGAANLLMLGASSVQMATDVLLNGYQRFSWMNGEVNKIGSQLTAEFFNYKSCNLKLFHEIGDKIRNRKLSHVRAISKNYYCNKNSCRSECTRQIFCPSVSIQEDKPAISACEGCGLCASLCPNKMIMMVPNMCGV